MKQSLILLFVLLSSSPVFASENTAQKESDIAELVQAVKAQNAKIEVLTKEVQALRPGLVNTLVKVTAIAVPALAVGYAVGIMKPIVWLAVEATKTVANFKELALQLNQTVTAATQLIPAKEQALPLLKEAAKRVLGL